MRALVVEMSTLVDFIQSLDAKGWGIVVAVLALAGSILGWLLKTFPRISVEQAMENDRAALAGEFKNIADNLDRLLEEARRNSRPEFPLPLHANSSSFRYLVLREYIIVETSLRYSLHAENAFGAKTNVAYSFPCTI